MPILFLSPPQVMGSRCTTGVPHDGWATKALIRWQSGERWIGRWIWIEIGFGILVGFGLSLVLDYRRRLFILPFN